MPWDSISLMDLSIIFTVPKNVPFSPPPSFLQSVGGSIVFRRSCHLPALLRTVCLKSKRGSKHGAWILAKPVPGFLT